MRHAEVFAALLAVAAITTDISAQTIKEGTEQDKRLQSIQGEAWIYYDDGKYADARRLVDKGLEIDPDAENLLTLSAALYRLDEKYEEALRQAQRARAGYEAVFSRIAKQKLDPVKTLGEHNFQAYRFFHYMNVKTCGVSNINLGHGESAKKDFLLLQQSWPDRFTAWEMGWLADAYFMTNDYAQAARYYKAARDNSAGELKKASNGSEREAIRQFVLERPAYNLVIL